MLMLIAVVQTQIFLEQNKELFILKSVPNFLCIFSSGIAQIFVPNEGYSLLIYNLFPLLFYFRTWLIVFQLINNSGMAVRYL
jgi:hypothetical protein